MQPEGRLLRGEGPLCFPERVTLLDAERQHAPENPQGPDSPEPSTTPAPSVSPCPSCGAEMVPGQDWCLSCGHAAPGTLGEKPGWRAFSTVAALVLVLVLGAGVAAYAALSSHKRKPVIAAAPPAQVAQTPPATAPPATSTPATTPPAAKPKQSKSLPKVTAPSTVAPGGSAVTPAPTTAPKTSTPTTSAPRTTTAPSTGTKSTTTPKSTAPAAPVLIKLDPSAGSTYDPYAKTAAKGDPAKALDGDAGTSWYVDPSAADGPVGAGYAIDLGSERSVKRIELTTTTPGFRVEVYASDVSPAPPDITDTRWSHITNVSSVGDGSGKQTIVVGGGTSKYQTVLLWITDRPTDGARVRISELKLFG